MSRLRRASGEVVRVPAGDVEVRAPVARPVEGAQAAPHPQVVYVPMPVQQERAQAVAPSSAVQVLALLVAVVAAFALGAYVLTAPPWQNDRPARVQQERGR